MTASNTDPVNLQSGGADPIRVCLVTASGHVFGAEKSLAYLAGHLAGQRAGTDYEFLLVSPGSPAQDLFRAMGIRVFCQAPLARFRKTCNPLAILAQGLRWLRGNFCIFRFCRRQRPDLIHANGLQALLYVGLAALALRLPVLWHVRDLGEPRWAVRLGARLAGAAIVPSRAAERELALYMTGKVQQVNNPIFPPAEKRGQEPANPTVELVWPQREAFTIGLVGQLIPRKGHDLALAAFAAIAEQVAGARLLFVGDDPFDPDSAYIRALRQTVHASSLLRERTAFIPYAAEVGPVCRALDMLVIPSRTEAFGRVAVEAMGEGCPVIAAQTGGLEETIEHGVNGLLFAPGDAQALADCVIRVAKDLELRRQLAREGRRTAEVFTRQGAESARQVGLVYRNLCWQRSRDWTRPQECQKREKAI